MKKIFVLMALMGHPFAMAQAAITYDLGGSKTAFTLNHQAISVKASDLLYQVATRGDSSVTRAQVAGRLVENRLLAGYAKSTYGQDELFDGQRVGFRHDRLMQNEVTATFKAAYRSQLNQAVSALPGGLPGTITQHHSVSAAEYDRVFGSTKKMLLEYKLDARHEALAQKITLLSYHFPDGGQGTISLKDVYAYQNVQGRVMIFNRDSRYIDEQAGLLLDNLFVLDWVKNSSGLSPADVASIRQAIEDRAYRDGLIRHMGIEVGAEEGTSYLSQLAAQVKTDDIRRYYDAHKDQFKQIDKVRASHIEVASEADAHQVSDALEKGMPFAEAAKRFSIADDRAKGGDMGWIAYTKAKPHRWIEQLAFIQSPGTTSRPVRTPLENGTAHWEIVRVEERTESYLPADSNEVRFAASDALAHQQSLQNFNDIKAKLVSSADVHVNSQWLQSTSLVF